MMTWQGGRQVQGAWRAEGLKVALVAARFNAQVVEPLVAGAFEAWCRLGGAPAALELIWVPGAFELPLAARRVAQAAGPHAVDAVVALGAIIRGGTPHFDYVAAQAASGVMQAGLTSDKPVVFGVLTCDTVEQALDRAGLKAGNKGADALQAAVETAQLWRSLAAPPSTRT